MGRAARDPERVYSEWMPIRDPLDGRIFRAFEYGGLVDLVMLDTRLWGRDEPSGSPDDPAVRDPARELLGLDQEAWLADRLRESQARWRGESRLPCFASCRSADRLAA